MKLPSQQASQQIPDAGRIIAAVISSRPGYAQQASPQQAQNQSQVNNTPAQSNATNATAATTTTPPPAGKAAVVNTNNVTFASPQASSKQADFTT